MLIAGASRHAKDMLTILKFYSDSLMFFDDTDDADDYFLGFSVIHSLTEAESIFKNQDRQFVLGVGSPLARYLLTSKLESVGGQVKSAISQESIIGKYQVTLEEGLNILPYSFISNEVFIGKGSLVNVGCSIHHDCKVGKFCQLAPGAIILGGSRIGGYSTIGSNATILPNVIVGKNVTVGAGAVIDKNIPDNVVVVGVPGIIIKEKAPLNL